MTSDAAIRGRVPTMVSLTTKDTVYLMAEDHLKTFAARLGLQSIGDYDWIPVGRNGNEWIRGREIVAVQIQYLDDDV